jgi:hypothetical protein
MQSLTGTDVEDGNYVGVTGEASFELCLYFKSRHHAIVFCQPFGQDLDGE